MNCAFFGHHDCPNFIKPKLYGAIRNQIQQGITSFYVGNHGNFDAMVLSCLRDLKQVHEEIQYAVVLAYLPVRSTAYLIGETLFPDGIESVPKRFAVSYRNRWMIDRSDMIISHIVRSWGGAAKCVEIARNRGATIINLL